MSAFKFESLFASLTVEFAFVVIVTVVLRRNWPKKLELGAFLALCFFVTLLVDLMLNAAGVDFYLFDEVLASAAVTVAMFRRTNGGDVLSWGKKER